MPRIVVTGGAGFIGSHVCAALLREGHRVVALDNFDEFYDPEIKRRNLRELLTHPRFNLVEGDIRDAGLVQRLLLGGNERGGSWKTGGDRTGAVIHLAARAGVRPSIEQPLLYQDVNVVGTTVLLEACRNRPECRFIFASSSSVYGNRSSGPFRESDAVDQPISPYAATKRAGELICHAFHHLFSFPVTCLRLFTVYGPRQRPDLAIHKFARLIERGMPVPVFGDGGMRRDFTFVDDIVDGILLALERCSGFHVYNLGGGRPVSVIELVTLLGRVLGREPRIVHEKLQPGDVHQTHADVTLARRELDFEPRTELESGLMRFAEWLRGEANS